MTNWPPYCTARHTVVWHRWQDGGQQRGCHSDVIITPIVSCPAPPTLRPVGSEYWRCHGRLNGLLEGCLIRVSLAARHYWPCPLTRQHGDSGLSEGRGERSPHHLLPPRPATWRQQRLWRALDGDVAPYVIVWRHDGVEQQLMSWRQLVQANVWKSQAVAVGRSALTINPHPTRLDKLCTIMWPPSHTSTRNTRRTKRDSGF